MRLYWETRGAADRRGGASPGATSAIPEMNRRPGTRQQLIVVAMYYRIFFQVGPGERVPAPDHGCQAGRAGRHRARLKADDPAVPRRSPVPPGPELLARDRSVRRHPARDRGRPDRRTAAGAEPRARTIYDYIVSELTAIQAELPPAGAATYGRATGPAAAHAAGRALPERRRSTPARRDYAEALTAAQAVIAGAVHASIPTTGTCSRPTTTRRPRSSSPSRRTACNTQTYGGTNFLIHASCGGGMSNSRLRRGRLLVGAPPQAARRTTASRAGRPAGLVLLHDRVRRIAIASICEFDRRDRGAQVPERDLDRRAGLEPGIRRTPTSRCSASPTPT